MAKHDLTAERLREVLLYDRETGFFTRKADVYQNSGRRNKDGHAGCNKQGGYRIIQVDRKEYLAHRLAWLYENGEWPIGIIDHIDGDPSNNSINNLRIASHAGNMRNIRSAHKDCSSGLLGAYKRHNKWISVICYNRKQIYLGSFASAAEAHEAYVLAKRMLHDTCSI